MTTITRHNWREYCTEPELLEQERANLVSLKNEAREDWGLMEFLIAQTAAESHAMGEVSTVDWDYSNLPIWADANRRLQRAQLVAWERWKGLANVPQQMELEL